MNRPLTLLLLLLCLSINTYAQLQPSGAAPGLKLNPDVFKTHIYHLTEDVNKLLAEDQAGIHYGIPVRVAVSVPVATNFFSAGKWMEMPGGGRFYRVQLSSPDAYALSVAFDDFYLPKHSQLFFYDAGKSDVIGGYTYKDNPPGKMFPGPIVTGDKVIIEYVEPSPDLVTEAPVLNIMELAHFYRNPDNPDKNSQIGTSWPCHININCSEGDDWQDVKRSVLRIYFKVGNSYGFCTGTLVNNTAQDGTPYVLTAYHCGGPASEEDRNLWQFRFNFERPGCADEGAPPQQSIPGATLKALKTMDGGSDFQLLELNFLPPPHFEPYYSGWDRNVVAPEGGVGIHHPNGDVKKISTFTTDPETINNAVISGYHLAYRSIWNVIFQPTANGHSVSQGGSSGSGMFNNDKKLVGTLTGGSSTCSNPYGNNLYAKFHHHWETNGTATIEQLRPWLDPINTGQMTLNGIDLYPAPSVQNLTATLDEDLAVTLHWERPAYQTPGVQWYANISNYTDVMNQTPERAAKFMITDQIEADTFYIKKLQHLFWEHPEYLWGGNTTFYFRIYDADGETLLHESPQLTAVNFQETNQTSTYQLDQDLAVTGNFYVSIVPSVAGTPSSLAMEILGEPASYFGEAGNWQKLTANGKNYELLVSVMGSVYSSEKDEYHKQIEQYGNSCAIGEEISRVAGEGNGLIAGEGNGLIAGESNGLIAGESNGLIAGESNGLIAGEGNGLIAGVGKSNVAGKNLIIFGSDIARLTKRMEYQETIKHAKNQLINNIKHYRIFRDSVLIHETEHAGIFSFTDPDDLQEDASYTYFMTAIYDINPSNPHSPDHESGKSDEITVMISHEDDDDDTALTDRETSDRMLLYPNPSSGIVHIILPESFEGGQLDIIDLNGNTVKFALPVTMSMQKIDLSSLPGGVYLVRLVTDKKVYTQRLVLY